MRQPHTEFRIGQKVVVFLRNGSQIIAKYRGKYRNGVILEGDPTNVKVDTDKIRQISIYKPKEKS